eukprot:419139-Prorocentrum_minimum.AAC.1
MVLRLTQGGVRASQLLRTAEDFDPPAYSQDQQLDGRVRPLLPPWSDQTKRSPPLTSLLTRQDRATERRTERTKLPPAE